MATSNIDLSDPAIDGFERYYAEKLWEWIPPVYRHEDGLESNPNPHALRAIVEVLAAQAATARRSIDRLWEDQFIDLCDDWAVPYLADMVGTRLLNNLNRSGRRVDVAKTIYYRRRKGTPVVMETLIQDIARWEGAVVESFRRLGRTRHRLDPEPGPLAGPVTGTLPGGTADLRAARASEVVDGPFDDFAHTPDFRRHRGWKGRYNIPKLNFHLYRLRAFEVNFATPVHFGSQHYTFDPSGRDVPLFAPDQRLDQAEWLPVEEWQLPAPIPCRLLNQVLEKFSPRAFSILEANTLPDPNDPADPPLETLVFQSNVILGGNLEVWNVGTVDPVIEVIVDPVRGRFLLDPAPTEAIHVPRYSYGFAGEIGAGTYDRPQPLESDIDSDFNDGGDDPGPINGAVPNNGKRRFTNSKTYVPTTPADGVLDDIVDLHVFADDQQRPYIQFSQNSWVFEANPAKIVNQDGERIPKVLKIDGLWLGFASSTDPAPVRRVIALEGEFDLVEICHCTLDPGGIRADGEKIPYVELEIRGQVGELVIDSCIMGPIKEATSDDDPCSVGLITIRDSIVQSITDDPAIQTRIGEVRLERVTVFGNVEVNRLHASEALVQGEVAVIDNQHSCIRFSAANSFNAEHFESHTYPQGLPSRFFTSRRFGDPGFAQLSPAGPEEIYRGAENRSEIGAFSSLLNAIKRDDLETKVLEYMPFGLIPQFIFET